MGTSSEKMETGHDNTFSSNFVKVEIASAILP